MSQASKLSLVGSVLERKPSAPATAPRASTNGGFPAVQHRSKSAFQRAREDQRRAGGPARPVHAPIVASTSPSKPSKDENDDEHPGSRAIAEATEDWRKQMEEENQRRVEAMTEEEREAERREILERFGPNVAEILRKARAAREAEQANGGEGQPSSPRSNSRVLKSAS